MWIWCYCVQQSSVWSDDRVASRDTDLDLTSVAVLNHITRFGLLDDPGKTCAHDEIWARHRYWEPSVPPNYYELSQGFG